MPKSLEPRAQSLLAAAFLVIFASSAAAQGWTFDARKIAMGNAAGGDHPASRMIDEDREYRAIVIPLGLIQVFKNRNIFNPDSDEFDIVKAIELASSPLHYQFGRDSASESSAGRQLVLDIRNAQLSRDLNAYRGFVPARQPVAEGLSHSAFGATIPVYRGDGGTSHGIFVGAGPYFSMRTSADIDQDLIDVLSSETDIYLPNTQFTIGVGTRGQMAAAITGGYRGRFGFANAVNERDGVYVAVDYNYLWGFRYEDIDTDLRLDTDGAGLLTFTPGVLPLTLGRDTSTSGRGFAIDMGVGVVSGAIEAGFGVKGIANRINWTEVDRRTYALGNLFTGNGDFVEGVPIPADDVRTELPKDYRGYVGVRSESTFVAADFAHGFQGNSFHVGAEQGLGFLDVRGGLIYTRDNWHPTGGVGLNFSERVGLDLALFGTSSNVQRERRWALAASIRINSLGPNQP
jgi:hypothetical protein